MADLAVLKNIVIEKGDYMSEGNKVYDRIACPVICIDIMTKDDKGRGIRDRQEELLELMVSLFGSMVNVPQSDAQILTAWDSETYKAYDFNQAGIDKIKKRIKTDSYNSLDIRNHEKLFESWDKDFGSLHHVFDFVINNKMRPGKTYKYYYDRLHIKQSLDFFNGWISSEEQQKWVSLLKQLYLKYQGIEGSICIDGYASSSYLYTEWEGFTGNLQVLERQLRGIFWGSILSIEQVNIMGGIEEIKRSGLFYSIEELENENGKHFYLQLTESIDSCTIEELKRLYGFLKGKDVLHSIFPPYFENKKNNDKKREKGYCMAFIDDEVKTYETE